MAGSGEWDTGLGRTPGRLAYAGPMKIVLIALRQLLSAWLALSAAMSGLIHALTDGPATDTVAVGLLAGGAALPAFGLLLSAGKRWRERATVRAGARGRPPADGRNVVLVGSLQPSGPLLKAPLDGSICLAYAYDIKVYRGSGKSRRLNTVARGVALTPSLIVTPTGRFKLLVVPDLNATATTASRADCVDNFVAYAARTPFIEAQASAQELLDRWSDDDGAFRSDVAFEPLHGVSTDGWLAQQQQVAPGAMVCVLGLYNQARGGIVPSAVGTPTRLIVGDAAHVAASLRKTATWHTFFGLLLAVPPALLVLKVWQASIPQ